MPVLSVPALDPKPWPTLGAQVAQWLAERAVHGPGELKGEPARLSTEFLGQLYRAYEVFPRDHPRAGRRRFGRVGLEEAKGTAKTERGAWVALAEAHPEAPVRCVGWRKVGRRWDPIGGPVQDPYIPMVSNTLEQTEDLAYEVLRTVIEEAGFDCFDVGLERILVLDDRGRAAGKVVPLAGSPNSRDGARTTFQLFDETHRMVAPRLVRAHTTMLQNPMKRRGADGWSLEITTAGEPGEGSVAEATRGYAEQIGRGEVEDPRLWFFARSATERELVDVADARAAVVEARGPNAEWSGDLDVIASAFFEPGTDRDYWWRVWGNVWRRQAGQAFDVQAWRALACDDVRIADGELVVLAFDGGRTDDSTALLAMGVESGHVEVVGIWERPLDGEPWECPVEEVDAAVAAAFERWDVWRLYGDPPYWSDWFSVWQGRYGEKRVIAWWTNRWKPMAWACRKLVEDIAAGNLSHAGDERLDRHMANACRQKLQGLFFDEARTEPMWVVTKDRHGSPRKVDGAVTMVLLAEARRDAVAAGAKQVKRSRRFVTF
jgi:hypothetical protein